MGLTQYFDESVVEQRARRWRGAILASICAALFRFVASHRPVIKNDKGKWDRGASLARPGQVQITGALHGVGWKLALGIEGGAQGNCYTANGFTSACLLRLPLPRSLARAHHPPSTSNPLATLPLFYPVFLSLSRSSLSILSVQHRQLVSSRL